MAALWKKGYPDPSESELRSRIYPELVSGTGRQDIVQDHLGGFKGDQFLILMPDMWF